MTGDDLERCVEMWNNIQEREYQEAEQELRKRWDSYKNLPQTEFRSPPHRDNKSTKMTDSSWRNIALLCIPKGEYVTRTAKLTSSMISHHAASYDDAGKLKDTPANRALYPYTASQEDFEKLFDLDCCYWHDDTTVILQGDALQILRQLQSTGAQVNCAVTSPPYYGQRDYGVEGEIGLERNPQDFIDILRDIFHELAFVLAETGSLWVNIGDTYWSGKGASTGTDSKQSARRFGKRPQDYPGDGHWMRPKQLLLIPHRMAIALQDDDWLVRNDNIWVKPNPLPDPVRDRCSVSHEHVFHFTKSRWYYFDKSKVGTFNEHGRIIPPKDTWFVQQSSGATSGPKGHKASYPLELLRVPVDSTTPDNGIVLDPFMGSGTTLQYARMKGFRSVGIELNAEYCDLAIKKIKEFG